MRLQTVARLARAPFAAVLLFGTAGIIAMIVALSASGGSSTTHQGRPLTTPTPTAAPPLAAPDQGTPAADIGPAGPAPAETALPSPPVPSPARERDHDHHHEDNGGG